MKHNLDQVNKKIGELVIDPNAKKGEIIVAKNVTSKAFKELQTLTKQKEERVCDYIFTPYRFTVK